jgi:Undecaprenyl-phosphate glucose phosphotransferase
MTVGTTIRSSARLPVASRGRDGQAWWGAAAIGIEVLVIAAITYGAFLAYNSLAYGAIPDRAGGGLAAIAIGTIYGGLCLADNQYDLLGDEWNRQGCSRGAGALALAFVLLLVIAFISDSLKGYSRAAFLGQLLVALLAQIVTRTILWQVIETARRRGRWRGAGMVILTMPSGNRAVDLRRRLGTRYDEVVRSYTLDPAGDKSCVDSQFDASIDEIRSECRTLKVGAVLIVFDGDNMELVTRAVSAFAELPVRIQLLPIGMADLMRQSRLGSCGRENVLELLCRPCSMRDRLLKRATDVVVAISLAALLSPFLLIVAVMIKLDSRGSVLFRQTRHGFNNEPIQVLKFRTMTTCDDSQHEFRQAVRGDPRVTRVGRFLRRTNLDEVPQLLNVLKGEMSMVGPRPHAVAHNEMYVGQIRGMSRRHNVKPGLTGWAQVNGLRGETDTVEKMQKRVEYDLYYIANWSLIFDIKIMIMTVISRHAYSNAY